MDCSKGYHQLGSNKALKLSLDLCVQIPEVMICCEVVWARPAIPAITLQEEEDQMIKCFPLARKPLHWYQYWYQ